MVVHVEIRPDRRRAREVVERAVRDSRRVDELDVADGVRRPTKVRIELDGAPAAGFLQAELQRVGVFGLEIGIAAKDGARVLAVLDRRELAGIRTADAARVA